MNRQGDIFGKYVGSGFLNGLNKGFDYADELQMLEDKQKQKDMYAGNQMADIYNAKKSNELNPDFLKVAKNANNEYKRIVSDYDTATQKKVSEVLNSTPTFNTVFTDDYDSNKTGLKVAMPTLLGKPSINYDDTSKIDYGVFSGQKTGEQVNPLIALNSYNDESKINLLGKTSPNNKNILTNGNPLNNYNSKIDKTLNYAEKSFWNGNMELLKKLQAPYTDYAINPASDYDDFIESPLTHKEKRISDLARTGNIHAINDMYDELYPQYNWNLRTRQIPSQDSKTMTVQEILSGYDKDGNYEEKIINSYNTAIIDKEALAHKRAMELQRLKNAGNIAAKKAGKGNEEDHFRLTANQFADDTKDIKDPVFKSALSFVNEHGTNDAYNMLRQYTPNLTEVKHDTGVIFGIGNNNKEYEKYNNEYKKNKEINTYFTNLYGSTDFYTNPLKDNYNEILSKYGYSIKIPSDRKNPNVYEFYIDGKYDSNKTIADIHNIINNIQ